MIELWKNIKNYEGYYQISNLGRVKSLKKWCGNKHIKKYIDKEQIIKPSRDNLGYLKVMLHKERKIENKRIHRLVAEAFLDNPNNLPVINHIDNNKNNNCVNNLEWCTQKHNVEEGIKCFARKYDYKGNFKKFIIKDKRYNRYYVRFTFNKKTEYLGGFSNIKDAVKKRDEFLKNNYIEIYRKIYAYEQV